MTDGKYNKNSRCRKCGGKMEPDIPYEAQTDWNNTHDHPMKKTTWFCWNDDCGNMCKGNPITMCEGKDWIFWLFDDDGDIGRVKQ